MGVLGEISHRLSGETEEERNARHERETQEKETKREEDEWSKRKHYSIHRNDGFTSSPGDGEGGIGDGSF